MFKFKVPKESKNLTTDIHKERTKKNKDKPQQHLKV